MAWGERYIDDLLEITIPALLAPGNLPAFAERFDCLFVIVTETRLFDRVARSTAIAGLLDFADLRLVPIDDLLSPWYGITLTYALVRGFADLGAAMTDTHLVFLNADFIVADGSYRKLAEAIGRGERLVVAPSYCMDLEATVDALRRRRDPASGALTLPHRELASIIIAHRHNTIRAKTVNQQLFRIHRYDQFYWAVDEQTLIGRQMPIAVVYMRPLRALTELPTFWDYGVISEYCPTVKPCVLGDSDDFLMAELRTEGTFRELLHLGRPSVEEIAADLSSFTTKDHHDYGRHTLVLHAGDLPDETAAATAELARYVDSVFARLGPPISYRDHPFWAPQFPLFIARQREAYRRRQQAEAARIALLRQDAGAAGRERRIADVRAEIVVLDDKMRGRQRQAAQQRRSAQQALSRLDEEHRRRRLAIEQDIRTIALAEEPGLGALRSRLEALETEAADLERQQQDAAGRLLDGAIAEGGADVCSESTSDAKRMRDASPLAWLAPRQMSARFLAWCAERYRRTFGRLPRTTPWHPYHTMLRPVMRALASAAGATEILVVSSGGPLTAALASDLTGRKLTITPAMLNSRYYLDSLSGRPRFDLCVCDLAVEDLINFRKFLDDLRPLLSRPCRIVVFHYNPTGRSLDDWTYEFTRGLFPLVGRSQVAFAGSFAGELSLRWFTRSLERHHPSRPTAIIALAAGLLISAPLARLAAWVEERRSPLRMPGKCTSMTIEIDLP